MWKEEQAARNPGKPCPDNLTGRAGPAFRTKGQEAPPGSSRDKTPEEKGQALGQGFLEGHLAAGSSEALPLQV